MGLGASRISAMARKEPDLLEPSAWPNLREVNLPSVAEGVKRGVTPAGPTGV